MSDLISREALRKAIKAECNPFGKPTIDFESGKKVLKIIDNAPTVEYPFYAEAYQTGYEEAKKELEF